MIPKTSTMMTINTHMAMMMMMTVTVMIGIDVDGLARRGMVFNSTRVGAPHSHLNLKIRHSAVLSYQSILLSIPCKGFLAI